MFWTVFDVVFKDQPNPDGNPYLNLPLAGPAYPVLLLSCVYMAFVFKWGPRWMEKRQPFQLRQVLFVYNVIQIGLNALLFVKVVELLASHYDVYNLGCMGSLPTHHPDKWWEVTLGYSYYLVKVFDYCDTIFFVLRKSYKQVTFLHVYHHILMSCFVYLHGRTYGFAGHLSFLGVVNTFVHAVMYSYYLLSAVRPNMQSTFWWKKYITMMQLVQFAMVVVQQGWPLVFWQSCPYPRFWIYFGLGQALLMFGLFSNFYRRAYCGKSALKPPTKTAEKVE